MVSDRCIYKDPESLLIGTFIADATVFNFSAKKSLFSAVGAKLTF